MTPDDPGMTPEGERPRYIPRHQAHHSQQHPPLVPAAGGPAPSGPGYEQPAEGYRPPQPRDYQVPVDAAVGFYGARPQGDVPPHRDFDSGQPRQLKPDLPPPAGGRRGSKQPGLSEMVRSLSRRAKIILAAVGVAVVAIVLAIVLPLATGGGSSGEPSGLHADGSLDVGACQISGGQASVPIWNPQGSVQHISSFGIEWGSNGVLLSEQNYNLGADVPSQRSEYLTAEAPGSATSCNFLGWNP